MSENDEPCVCDTDFSCLADRHDKDRCDACEAPGIFPLCCGEHQARMCRSCAAANHPLGSYTEGFAVCPEDGAATCRLPVSRCCMTAAATADVCTCGHDVTDHGNGPVGCIHRDGCDGFRAAPTGPAPRTDAAVER